MPEYLAPAVYVEETSFRSRSLEGVGTSTAGFVGLTARGPAADPSRPPPPLLTSFADYERIYGGFERLTFQDTTLENYMAHAVRAFFDNGGGRLYVARVVAPGAVRATSADGKANAWFESRHVMSGRITGTDVNLRVTLRLDVQPVPMKSARSQPRGTLLQMPVAGKTSHGFVFMTGGDGTPLRNGAKVPADDAASVGIVTVTALVEDPSGMVLELGGLGLHPDHPRAIGAIMGPNPPRADDALTVPVVIAVKDGVANSAQAMWTAFFEPQLAALEADWAAAAALPAALDKEIADADAAAKPALQAALPARKQAAEAMALQAAALQPRPTSVSELRKGLEGAGFPNATAFQDGLDVLGVLEDISMIAAPGAMALADPDATDVAAGFATALITAAEKQRAYRIAVIDTPPGMSLAQVRALKGRLDSTRAALYYPWVIAPNPLFGVQAGAPSAVSLPPSGFVCGVYARTDIERGVWKAPANETVLGAVNLERAVGFGEQEVLNPLGVNCIRLMPNRGYRIWGARTLSSDPEWRYVNVRRYFLYLEASIDRGTQWAVFEPNGERLWANVRETVSDFLYNEWINGALLGAVPKEAFFVRCDRSTMTQNDLDNGRLVCLIGVAAIKPAEFVIFRVGQKTVESRG